jgi:hypothetical protein
MNRGKDPYVVGLRRLNCQWCTTTTVHDTHKSWLHCQTCQRCYSCGEAKPCAMCQRYDAQLFERLSAGVISADWLDQAMQWMRDGK